jgi:hypothetical protein
LEFFGGAHLGGGDVADVGVGVREFLCAIGGGQENNASFGCDGLQLAGESFAARGHDDFLLSVQGESAKEGDEKETHVSDSIASATDPNKGRTRKAH